MLLRLLKAFNKKRKLIITKAIGKISWTIQTGKFSRMVEPKLFSEATNSIDAFIKSQHIYNEIKYFNGFYLSI